MLNDGAHPTPKKTPGSLLLLVVLVAWSWFRFGLLLAGPAQNDAADPQAAPVQKTEPSAKKGTAATPPSPAAEKEKPGKKKTTKPAPAQKTASEQPAPKTKQEPLLVGHRDPFKIPQPGRLGEGIEEIKGPLPPGTRGLIIGQLRLEGIVRQDLTNTMIAVVVPSNVNRAYFLREKDAVFNGVVSKITPDAIYFAENYLDPFGQVQTREVVKRLGSAPGEGR